MSDFRPRRRERAIKVEEFEGELLVYDLESHKAHCLNGIAVSIWRLCDGRRSVPEIAAQIARDQEAEPNQDLIWHALAEFETAGLMVAGPRGLPIDPSRRQALGRLGWVAGIPLVLSITVPTPGFAQSVVTVITVITTPG